MVYIEYNNSKKINVDYEIEVTESNGHEGYTLLPFSPFVKTYPTSSKYPIENLQNEESTEYLLKLIVDKTIPYGNYYFEYDNKYYLFTAGLKPEVTVYFKLEEVLPEGQQEWITIPVLYVTGYRQDKTVLPVYDELEINKSGTDITFSTVKVDYGIRDKNLLPITLQEMRIWQGKLVGEDDLSGCELIYTGFLDSATVSQKINNDDECDIEFSLLSPENMTTRRYITLNGVYSTNELFSLVFSPLIEDGFKLEEVDVEEKNVSVKYCLETIETVMNDLSNKLNIFWTIDIHKNIHITDILKLLTKEPKMIIQDEVKGMYQLQPTIENNGYFNCVNVKNARVYTSIYNLESIGLTAGTRLKKGASVKFKHPIDFGVNGAKRVCDDKNEDVCHVFWFMFNEIEGAISTSRYYWISYHYNDSQIVLPEGMAWSTDNDETAEIVLEVDSFFSNLVTGFTWQGENDIELSDLESDTMLKYELFRLTNAIEVDKCIGKITDSGIIENTIDANESWFTHTELVDYCNSLIGANAVNTTTVDISFDENYNLDIGDTIRINEPNFFIEGDFVITDISEKKYGYNEYDCHIVAKNNKLLENYIDIFRKDKLEEDEDKYDRLNVFEYISEEIVENYNVYTGDLPEVEEVEE